MPIDRLLLPLVPGTSKGIVVIIAPPGGGKTTALQYLRAILPADMQLGLFDASQVVEARQAAASGLVVLTTADAQAADDFVEVFTLCPWTLDDCLEYLAAVHRQSCSSVLSRLGRDRSLSVLRGSPQLLSLVMDAMAGDVSLENSRDILRRQVQQIIPAGPALDRLILDGPIHAPLNNEQWRWWRHEAIQQICSADWIASQLCQGIIPKKLESMDEGADLVPEIGAAVRSQPAAIDYLTQFLHRQKRSPAIAMVASILLAVDANWRPADARGLNLVGAHLPSVRWAGMDLTAALLQGANLAGADLSGAILNAANAEGADLSGASLRGALWSSPGL